MTAKHNPLHRYPARTAPERIVLRALDNVAPVDKPPVRIFVGSEPAQYRAERTFLWSVHQHRDPAREYEIYLMKELTGFDDRRWLTGFTNYRFAIPGFAGNRGRAIYNDIDQVYLDDPAKLFDLDLGKFGYLAVAPRDISVMLLDCDRMGKIWTEQRAQTWRKNKLIDVALKEPGIYGPLGGEWNARDQDHVAGWSKCVHFTTIHKQPWRPFPDRFFYQPNPAANLYAEMEQSALANGFNVFNAAQPSSRFARVFDTVPVARPNEAFEQTVMQAADDLIRRSSSRTVLNIEPLSGREPVTSELADYTVEQRDVKDLLSGLPDSSQYDGVICAQSLDSVPTDDLPWVVDEIVGMAHKFLLLVVRETDSSRQKSKHRGMVHRAQWWIDMLTAASARRTELHWTLIVAHDEELDPESIAFHHGGRHVGQSPPTVWLLEDHKPGHTTQSLGLVDALGWPHQRIKLEFGALAARPNFLRGPTLRGLTSECAKRLVAPWPDLVVASGARTAPVAEWIRRESKGRTRTVHLGRKGSHHGNNFDLSVAPSYIGLYPDPRRMETMGPITRVDSVRLAAAADHWRDVLTSGPSPRVALLVGGDDSMYSLDVAQARRMGAEVATFARDAGGSVFVTTSRRTHPEAARALVAALGNATIHSYHWSAANEEKDNPYLGYLALADVLIVSGESASMLAEATATGKPVYIYPLARRSKDTQSVKFRLGQGVSAWIMNRAFARPRNRRGWERPQTGLELLCARIAARGWVRPHGDITKFHQALIERGNARYFDGALCNANPEPLYEAQQVAERVRKLVGFE